VLPSGQLLSPRQITSHLNTIQGVAIYRFNQLNLERAVVEYVRSRFHTDTTVEKIHRCCIDLLSSSVEVRVREVSRETLPQKIRPVVSKVPDKRLKNLSTDVSD